MSDLPPLEKDQVLLDEYPVPEQVCEACGQVPIFKVWGPYRVEKSYWRKVWLRILGRDTDPWVIEGTFELEIACEDYEYTPHWSVGGSLAEPREEQND